MPSSPSKITEQVSFSGGLNAVASPHTIGEMEVAAGTNVDFDLESGAASARRGSLLYGTATLTSTSTAPYSDGITMIARNYGLSTGTWQDAAIPWYVSSYDGNNWTGSGTSLPIALGTIPGYMAGYDGNMNPQYAFYNDYIYIANLSGAFRTNGTSTYDWLIPQADTPTVTLTPQWNAGPAFVGFAGTAGSTNTYTGVEGSVTATSTSTAFGTSAKVVLATCTTGTGSRIVITGPTAITNWENPVPFLTNPTGTALTSAAGTYTLGGAIDFHQGWPMGDTTGASGTWTSTAYTTQTLTLGNYSTDFLLLSIPNQQSIVTIQRDLSIGDATFTNYWHSETTASAINDATIDPVSAVLTAQGLQSIDQQQQALNANRGLLPHVGAGNTGSLPPIRRTISKASISNTPSPWAVSRSDYQFIGSTANPDFTNIQAVRVIIEFNTVGQSAVISGFANFGGLGYCLNDQAAGISYYQTFARVENGIITHEGPASIPTVGSQCQYAHAAIVCASNTNTTAGITHRVFYRTGGFLSDAYRVGSCTITSGTATIYDYALPDMTVIGNPTLRRNLWTAIPPLLGSGFLGVDAISPQPWQNRIWFGCRNLLFWSWPGIPSQIQTNSQVTVGNQGDIISAIHSAQNLVIVNQASVYEISGSIFEGTNQNWTLNRTASRRGSIAPKTCVNTPYGIFLLSYDGCSFYRPGFGVDQELAWVYDKIGDLWKGTGAADPAALKGRIPALNHLNIFNSSAAYKDGRVYLAVPTGSQKQPNTVFVLDIVHQKVWMHTYPFNITVLFFDKVGNRLIAGTDQATLMQIETGLTDQGALGGGALGIAWSYTTREWTTPMDSMLENLQVENIGTCTWLGDIDNTNTYTLGTTTSSVKSWSPVSLQGSVGDNLNFIFQGTQSGTYQSVYGIQWDAVPLSNRVLFWQTDPVAVPSENYVKTWLADLNCFGGTCTGSVLVDGTVVQTATFISSNTAGQVLRRRVFETGLPNITAGKNISVIYNAASLFRHYDTQFEFEPKPFGKTTWLVTYKKAGGVTQADLARFYAMDIEGLATHTITSTWLIDGTTFSTNTLTFGATDAGEETGIVRNYMDWIPFPPGGRGYLFQQQVTSTDPFRVWRSSLDIDRLGIKGLSRVTMNGTPAER